MEEAKGKANRAVAEAGAIKGLVIAMVPATAVAAVVALAKTENLSWRIVVKKTFAMLVFALLLSVVLSGCWSRRYVIIRPRAPIIREVERPKLPKITQQEIDKTDATGKKLLKATKGLKVYSKVLESGIQEYNKWAKKQNKDNGYDDVLKNEARKKKKADGR